MMIRIDLALQIWTRIEGTLICRIRILISTEINVDPKLFLVSLLLSIYSIPVMHKKGKFSHMLIQIQTLVFFLAFFQSNLFNIKIFF
jgi:hypothetical protein